MSLVESELDPPVPPHQTFCKKMISWLQRIFSKPQVPSATRSGKAEFDAESVRFYHPEGEIQHIRWDELDEVGIVTTDEGPFVEDVFFMLLSVDKKGCAIPQSAEGNKVLLTRLQMLPGFDNNALIEAMGCTSNQNFRLWKKTAEQAVDGNPH
ncbi:MAG: hypothetical protein ABIT37_07080 [Luteolibacter sp.]